MPSILVVDDHPPSFEALEAILAPLDAVLVRATSGTEAVALAMARPFALVLLDMQMPELDGFETAARLKRSARSRPLPIIIVSSIEPTHALVERGYASGAIDFLWKPLDAHTVRSKVALFVEIHRNRASSVKPSEPRLRAEDAAGRVSERLLAAAPTGDRVAEIVEGLVRVHDALSGGLEVAVVAQRFVEEAARLCGADAGALRYSSHDRDCVATTGVSAEELTAIDASCAALAPAFREGRTVRIDDLLAPGASAALPRGSDLRSLLVVPILGPRGQVAGVVVAGSETRAGFGAREEELLAVATRHAAVAIENGLLYEQAEEARERAELAELETRSQGTRLRMALDSAGLGTWDYNPRGPVLRLDERARWLHGFDGLQAVGFDHILQRIHGDDRSRVRAAVMRALTKLGELEEEYRVVRPEGADVRWLDVRGQAFVEGGRAVRFLGTVMDVTSRKRVEEERTILLGREKEAREAAEHARMRAEDASRAKDQFLATVSHELRNPLGAILGWAQVLLADAPAVADAHLRRGLEVIARNASTQAQLVEDLLEVSRIEAGKLRLSTLPVDVRAAVDGAVDTVSAAAHARGVALEAAYEQGVGSIVADPDRLAQILFNLLSNAVKFTPRGGRVRVAVRQDAEHIGFEVTDTGEGIAAEFLPHVFDLFRQADGSTTRRHGGLGLGLAIVRHLAELHGGTVTASSAGKGKGASFTAWLPTAASAAPLLAAEGPRRPEGATAHPSSPVAAPLSGLRVLVVDDEEDMRDLVAMLVERAGAEVTRASNVLEAVETIEARPYDLVVSDLAMPEEDGYDLLRRLRGSTHSHARAVPVVAITAYTRAEDRKQVMQAGFAQHVAKPVEPARLVSTLLDVVSPTGRALHTREVEA